MMDSMRTRRARGAVAYGALAQQPPGKPEGLAESLLKLLAVFLLPLLFILTVMPTGYLMEGPGPSFGLQGSLSVEGAETYPSQGEFLLTSVRLKEAVLINHIVSLLGRDYDMLRLRDYFGEDLDIEEQDLVDELLTILSQDAATVVALEELEGVEGEGNPQVEVEKLGVLVVAVGEGYPADGVVKPGEVIVAVDSKPVADGDGLRDAIDAAGVGEEVEIEVRGIKRDLLDEEAGADDAEEAGAGGVEDTGYEKDGAGGVEDTGEGGAGKASFGEEWTSDSERRVDPADLLAEEGRLVRLAPVWDDELGRAVIGVSVRDYFSYVSNINVNWRLEDIKGPSAGLMMTLSLIDALTPEDLTGGRKIAGTGEIALNGDVGPIGGLPMKIEAAERQGAEVFIYPVENQDELERVSTALKLYAVDDLQDALDILQETR